MRAVIRCTQGPVDLLRRACSFALTSSASRVRRQRWAAAARQHAALQVDCPEVRRDAQDHPRRLEWPLLGKDDTVGVLYRSRLPTRCPPARTACLLRAVEACQKVFYNPGATPRTAYARRTRTPTGTSGLRKKSGGGVPGSRRATRATTPCRTGVRTACLVLAECTPSRVISAGCMPLR